MLRILHEDTVGLFVNSPGFGVARVMLPSESLLEIDARGVAPVPQPVPRASALNLTPGFVGQPKASPNNEDYNRHWQGVADFTDRRNRGYVRDRQHVAGFRPHRLSEVPGVGSQRMAVETVELVSLLRFSEPAVYISADLPRMDELRDAPTRLLDDFESAALRQLRDGEDLVAVQVALSSACSGRFATPSNAWTATAAHAAICWGRSRIRSSEKSHSESRPGALLFAGL
jgi:hypothetical protein